MCLMVSSSQVNGQTEGAVTLGLSVTGYDVIKPFLICPGEIQVQMLALDLECIILNQWIVNK